MAPDVVSTWVLHLLPCALLPRVRPLRPLEIAHTPGTAQAGLGDCRMPALGSPLSCQPLAPCAFPPKLLLHPSQPLGPHPPASASERAWCTYHQQVYCGVRGRSGMGCGLGWPRLAVEEPPGAQVC